MKAAAKGGPFNRKKQRKVTSNDQQQLQVRNSRKIPRTSDSILQVIPMDSDDMIPFYPNPRTPNRPPLRNHNDSDACLISPPMPRRITHQYPVQSRRMTPTMSTGITMVGDPSLCIYRLSLPPHLLQLLDTIVLSCEAHAATLPNGWMTDVYSLTKQDIVLRNVPAANEAALPIFAYIKKCIQALWKAKDVTIDSNQPHVLKYDMNHRGVQLHHDKCDVTANLCLSRTTSYVGGGTCFPRARQVVRLEYGEFLIHPGSLVHGGMDIESGTRHLMVIFAQIAK